MKDWRHYLGRGLDRWVLPHVPKRKRLAANYYRYAISGWEPEVRRIRAYARPGLAVDVGANMGLWTYAMASFGLFRQVFAFEPNRALTADLRNAGFSQVTVIHQALSSVSGKAVLRTPRLGGMLLNGWASLEDRIDVATADFPVWRFLMQAMTPVGAALRPGGQREICSVHPARFQHDPPTRPAGPLLTARRHSRSSGLSPGTPRRRLPHPR